MYTPRGRSEGTCAATGTRCILTTVGRFLFLAYFGHHFSFDFCASELFHLLL
jgi:hypothetical protein